MEGRHFINAYYIQYLQVSIEVSKIKYLFPT